MMVLGIETSCDETAAAVVANGRDVISSFVASQIEAHRPYGGVVPELASRMHVENISRVTRAALDQAGLGLSDVDLIAATRGPGLVGALLVGFCHAKALAFGRGLPLVGVDHLDGHLYSVFLDGNPPPLPFAALLASGGHTAIYKVEGVNRAVLLGQTLDDAAGEAFDKVAKMMGKGYPGGPVIGALAAKSDGGSVSLPRPFLDREGFDFSFSGLKTAVLRHLQTRPQPEKGDPMPDFRLAAGFQEAVVDVLSEKLCAAAQIHDCPAMVVVGGVAANTALRNRLAEKARETDRVFFAPPLKYCGDNAAMIAGLGFHLAESGRYADLYSDVYSRAERRKMTAA